jgi:hypothetical protein
MVKKSGGQFSKGKHFVTRSFFVFTEILGEVSYHARKVYDTDTVLFRLFPDLGVYK